MSLAGPDASTARDGFRFDRRRGRGRGSGGREADSAMAIWSGRMGNHRRTSGRILGRSLGVKRSDSQRGGETGTGSPHCFNHISRRETWRNMARDSQDGRRWRRGRWPRRIHGAEKCARAQAKARERIDTSSSDGGAFNCTSLVVASHANSSAATLTPARSSCALWTWTFCAASTRHHKTPVNMSRDLASHPRFDATAR